MNFKEEFYQSNTIFIDTAPIIYYIESHLQFGPLVKEVVELFQSGRLTAFSSVITITEVLPKPVESGNKKLAKKFVEFLKYGKNFNLIEISINIAERAGELLGKYPSLKTIDALQISTAIDVGTDIFLTNDQKLKQIKELKVLVLKDYL